MSAYSSSVLGIRERAKTVRAARYRGNFAGDSRVRNHNKVSLDIVLKLTCREYLRSEQVHELRLRVERFQIFYEIKSARSAP